MDSVYLSRIQFGLTVGFHFIFVTLSLGMAWLLFALETTAWRSGDERWLAAAKFFGKIFVLTFVFGVSTGIVMEFQFGTNWASYSRFVGDIFGPPLAIETLATFFLESVFIAVYVFGRGRLSQGLHWFSSLMIAFGATLSAFWILVANSWMQTPAGYALRNGRVEIENLAAVVFTPSMWPRFFHTLDGVLIAGAFFMAGVAAYLILKQRQTETAAKVLRLGLIAGLIFSILELYPFGHFHVLNVAQYQPAKFATFEALTKNDPNAPFIAFGIPIKTPAPEVKLPIALAGMMKIMLQGINVPSMDTYKSEDLPPFVPTFATFHLMVYMGMFFIAMMIYGCWKLHRRTIMEQKNYLRLLVWSIPLPIIACQLGWMTAEVGRQPWIIYGLMRTSDAGSSVVGAGQVLASIILFSVIYVVMGIMYAWLLCGMIRKGPQIVTPN